MYDWRFNNRLRRNDHWRFGYRRWLGSNLSFRLLFGLSRSGFNLRSFDHFDFDQYNGLSGEGFNSGCFYNSSFNGGCFHGGRFNLLRLNGYSRFRSLLGSGCGAFGLLIRLGFSRGADDRACNSFCYGKTGSQLLSGCRRGFFAVFFAAFNYVAIGIALTLTTIAATTLTA